MKYILALDQGTTRSRAIVFNEAGQQAAAAQKEFKQIFLQPGWVEHNPREIRATQRAVASDALPRMQRVYGATSQAAQVMQMQADFRGLPVLRPRLTQVTALGAAYLPGLACGVWRDASELTALWKVDRAFEPMYSQDRRQDKLQRWRKAVERSRAWAD